MSQVTNRITRKNSDIDKTKRKASDLGQTDKAAKVSKMSDENTISIAQMLQQIHQTTSRTNTEVQSIKTQFNDMNKRLETVETKIGQIDTQIDEKIDQKMRSVLGQNVQNMNNVTTNGVSLQNTLSEGHKDEYWASTRSIMLYPIYSENQQQFGGEFRTFLIRTLGFSQIEAEAMETESLKLVLKRRRGTDGAWKMTKMIRIQLKSREDRDLIMSRISNLATDKKYKMEMEVPDFLTPLYRSLEKKAFEIRRLGDTKKKTSVRYDDENLSLMLLTRGDNQGWQRHDTN